MAAGAPAVSARNRPAGDLCRGDLRSGNVKRVASAVGEGSIAVAFVHQVLRQSRTLMPPAESVPYQGRRQAQAGRRTRMRGLREDGRNLVCGLRTCGGCETDAVLRQLSPTVVPRRARTQQYVIASADRRRAPGCLCYPDGARRRMWSFGMRELGPGLLSRPVRIELVVPSSTSPSGVAAYRDRASLQGTRRYCGTPMSTSLRQYFRRIPLGLVDRRNISSVSGAGRWRLY